ncbi:MAG: hypothetical protein U9N53_11890 [Bacteroidota bacterium]|nr:hypothetical protein [Bacteroidota bacterium]
MKLSFRIYLLAGILLISSLFSARKTLQKMRNSADQTDKVLVSLDEMNKNQEKIFTQFERKFENYIDWEKLQKDSLKALKSPLKNNFKTIPFATVGQYSTYQIRMEAKNRFYYELLTGFEPDSSPDFQNKEMHKQIYKYQELSDSLKNEYNQSARHHNSYIKGFPRNFYSSFFHFQSKAYIYP